MPGWDLNIVLSNTDRNTPPQSSNEKIIRILLLWGHVHSAIPYVILEEQGYPFPANRVEFMEQTLPTTVLEMETRVKNKYKARTLAMLAKVSNKK